MSKCPIIMAFQKEYCASVGCLGDECEFWDEKNEQCCIKTLALAAAAKPPVTPVVL